MTVLVTGASGHIGGNLVRALLEGGRQVRVLLRDDARAVEGLDVERCAGDTRDADSLRAACRGADAVYHLAGVIAISAAQEELLLPVNVQGTENLARACLQAGVRRLVHFSSVHALVEHPFHAPVAETRALAIGEENLPYARSKAEGELRVMQAVADGLDAVILNPTGVLGPFDFKPSHMGQLLVMLQQRRMPALVHGVYDWVDARDVARSALAAEKEGRCGERYLLPGHRASIAELAARVAEITGVPAPRFTTPCWAAKLGAPFVTAWAGLWGQRPLYTSQSLQVLEGNSHIDGSKARAELGHRARPLKETLQEFFAWHGRR